ncbi:frataxin [Encephalitozoon intestinalis ATCC 50506]|uniref:Frataxin n=1 Tax=Encephalitozoon intestinalis (strain ATCC 50506) TaxID=876142 RepID=E0S5K1_ENCIT|nr:frataxin [Encephalitozoon intestinalis ATCC 50506]ADM10986.1 frataxin [Encephalitozoon intestinalis ATCC 50506]UTX44623.1 frataxin [Encephalitozoon intestinalis]
MALGQKLQKGIPKPLYHRLADEELSDLSEHLERKLCNEYADYKDGNLQIRIEGIGEYMFNKQPAAMQIWASSPITGPRKFDICKRYEWIDLRNNISLSEYVKEELKKIQSKIGRKDK